ncbi:MAG: hypothetical protein IJ026_00135 [Candidatus Methanomethylophilaceae archaeon]|nr:hypothetical protein [Candidatus Methanomethylophilaceae archaeon]
MGINMGIREMEASNSPCRELRARLVKVHVDDTSGIEDLLEYDEVVDLDTARGAVGDWEAFLKRNRMNAETDAVYIDKLKKDADRDLLVPLAERVCTGWVPVGGLDGDALETVLSRSSEEDRLTGWDMLSFDEMNAMCADCPLSWDKGRGCIGAFGPDKSLLPGIAEKHGCPIVASVPASAAEGRVFTADDAEKLLAETGVLKDALPGEGKMAVHRYSGPVERLEAMARACVSGGCGFYFF